MGRRSCRDATHIHTDQGRWPIHKPSLDNFDSLPPPDEIAAEIVENLQAALEQFLAVAEALAAPK
jgi:hypothetical protein